MDEERWEVEERSLRRTGYEEQDRRSGGILRFEGQSEMLAMDLKGGPFFLENDGRLAGKTVSAETSSSPGFTCTAHLGVQFMSCYAF